MIYSIKLNAFLCQSTKINTPNYLSQKYIHCWNMDQLSALAPTYLKHGYHRHYIFISIPIEESEPENTGMSSLKSRPDTADDCSNARISIRK
jgi:hypothetical protein